MKKCWALQGIGLAAACALVALAGCARETKAVSEEEAYQRFVGTWVNTEYPGTVEWSQITVIRPDHVGEDWLTPKSTFAAGEWTIAIKKTWVDEKGYTYCQIYNTRTKPEEQRHSVAALMRVDKKGKVWELCVKPFGPGKPPSAEKAVYPEAIDSSLKWYWVYYRKK